MGAGKRSLLNLAVFTRLTSYQTQPQDAPPLTFPQSDPIPRVSLVPAQVQNQAHGIYDTNAVAWNARRYEDEEDSEAPVVISDAEKSRRRMEMGLVATAGDDGSVRVWISETK